MARHHLRADARLGVEALTAALAVRTTTWRSEAMAARLDKNVVLFDGDGSLMMHVQERETIKRHRMYILIVVINDGAYGSEVHKLRSEGDARRRIGVRLLRFRRHWSRFRRTGEDVQESGQSAEHGVELTKTGGAAIWDFHVSDKVVSPTIRRAHPHPAKEKNG